MWKQYFRFVKLEPGRVVTSLFGEIDFSSDTIDLETIKALYESGFPFLEITDQGKAELYPTTIEIAVDNAETAPSIRMRKPKEIPE